MFALIPHHQCTLALLHSGLFFCHWTLLEWSKRTLVAQPDFSHASSARQGTSMLVRWSVSCSTTVTYRINYMMGRCEVCCRYCIHGSGDKSYFCDFLNFCLASPGGQILSQHQVDSLAQNVSMKSIHVANMINHIGMIYMVILVVPWLFF